MKDLKPKILAILSLIFLDFTLYIIATTPPAKGYELSIYNAYPSYVFLLILISFSCSMLGVLSTVIHTYPNAKRRRKLYSVIFIFTIIVLNSILLLLPLFRGYAFYGRHDALTHIGMIKDILRTGYVGRNNFYPFFHIFSTATLQVTGINIFLIRNFISLLFYILYIFYIYLITKKITKDGKASLFAFLFASIPLLGNGLIDFTPSGNLFFIMPFFLYLFFLALYSRSTKMKILPIFGLILLPYMHPEIIVFFTTFLLLFFLFFIPTKSATVNIANKKNISRLAPIYLLIILVHSFVWLSGFSYFRLRMQTIYQWFFKSTPPITQYKTLLSRAGFSINEFIGLLIKREGAVMIYLICATLIVFMLIKNMIYNRRNTKKIKRKVDKMVLFFGLLFILWAFFTVFSIFNYIIIGFGRILKYVILSSTILISIFLIRYSKININASKKKIAFFIIFTILVTSLTISTFNLYPSPTTQNYNSQVTTMGINGASWLVEFGNKSVEPIDIFVVFGRFVHAIEGYQYSMQNDRKYATALYNVKRYPPDHFNYTYHETLGDSYMTDNYLLTNELMRQFYFKLWPAHARFTPDDFRKLDIDPTVNKIYENSEFEIRYINAKY